MNRVDIGSMNRAYHMVPICSNDMNRVDIGSMNRAYHMVPICSNE